MKVRRNTCITGNIVSQVRDWMQHYVGNFTAFTIPLFFSTLNVDSWFFLSKFISCLFRTKEMLTWGGVYVPFSEYGLNNRNIVCKCRSASCYIDFSFVLRFLCIWQCDYCRNVFPNTYLHVLYGWWYMHMHETLNCLYVTDANINIIFKELSGDKEPCYSSIFFNVVFVVCQ